MTTVELHWTPSKHARHLLSVAVLAGLAVLVTGRAELLVLAGPALLLLVATVRAPRPPSVHVRAAVSPARCLEGEPVRLDVHVTAEGALGSIRVAPTPLPHMAFASDHRPHVALSTGDTQGSWELQVQRWGRWSAARLGIEVRDRGGLWQAFVTCRVGEVIAYPRPAALTALVLPEDLAHRIGVHPARSSGTGLEFAGIRPYVPGDPPRDIHWPASLRQGELQVILRAAERSADVVVAVDAFSDVGGSLDRSVRGCAGLARAYLRVGDRVGLAVLGGALRTLPPDTGQRTLYRITDAVLGVRRDDSVVSPQVDRIPSHIIPRHGLVVLFSPLLDDRTIATVADLHTRGTATVVVDVLTSEPDLPPRPSTTEELTLRLWRLDRRAQRHRLIDRGIPVVSWDAHAGLDVALSSLTHRPLLGGRP